MKKTSILLFLVLTVTLVRAQVDEIKKKSASRSSSKSGSSESFFLLNTAGRIHEENGVRTFQRRILIPVHGMDMRPPVLPISDTTTRLMSGVCRWD